MLMSLMEISVHVDGRGLVIQLQLVELLVMMMDAILLNSQLTKFLSRVYHKSTTDVFHPKTILFMLCMLMKLMAFQESTFGHIMSQDYLNIHAPNTLSLVIQSGMMAQ